MKEKLKILILEDNASDAELMERALQDSGISFSAVRADTGPIRAADHGGPGGSAGRRRERQLVAPFGRNPARAPPGWMRS